MIRLLYTFLTATAIFFICTGQTINQTKDISSPFDALKYDKVVAYDFNGEGGRSIVINGKLCSGSKIKTQKELTTVQISKLHKIINDTKTYGGYTAACFEPHLGFVYYRQNIIVGHISICLSCNFLQSSETISATQSYKTKVCDKCFAKGFSKKGRNKISMICKELQFSHWELKAKFSTNSF